MKAQELLLNDLAQFARANLAMVSQIETGRYKPKKATELDERKEWLRKYTPPLAESEDIAHKAIAKEIVQRFGQQAGVVASNEKSERSLDETN